MNRKPLPKIPLWGLVVFWVGGLAAVVLLALIAMQREEMASDAASDPAVRAQLIEMDQAQEAYRARKEAERRKLHDLPLG